jgi:hypothetical protein
MLLVMITVHCDYGLEPVEHSLVVASLPGSILYQSGSEQVLPSARCYLPYLDYQLQFLGQLLYLHYVQLVLPC